MIFIINIIRASMHHMVQTSEALISTATTIKYTMSIKGLNCTIVTILNIFFVISDNNSDMPF